MTLAQAPAPAGSGNNIRRGRFRPNEVLFWRIVYALALALAVVFRSRLDAALSQLWTLLLEYGVAQLDAFEPVVSTLSFLVWINLFRIVDVVKVGKRFKLHPEYDPVEKRGGLQSYVLISPHGKATGCIAIIAYLAPLFVLDLFWPRRQSSDYFNAPTPTFFQLLQHLCTSLFVYDFLFFWPHYLMHASPFLYRIFGHREHHRSHPLVGGEVVHHSFIDGSLQVLANILTLNALQLPGLSRMMHDIVVTYLLTESHSGYDAPFMLHNVLPLNVMGGSPRHEHHHARGNVYMQQFFTYLDDLRALLAK